MHAAKNKTCNCPTEWNDEVKNIAQSNVTKRFNGLMTAINTPIILSVNAFRWMHFGELAIVELVCRFGAVLLHCFHFFWSSHTFNGRLCTCIPINIVIWWMNRFKWVSFHQLVAFFIANRNSIAAICVRNASIVHRKWCLMVRHSILGRSFPLPEIKVAASKLDSIGPCLWWSICNPFNRFVRTINLSTPNRRMWSHCYLIVGEREMVEDIGVTFDFR